MKYFSHSEGKLLTDHIANILKYDEQDEQFKLTGKWHDCGKVSDSFQSYITKAAATNDGHSVASALLFLLSNINGSDLATQKHMLFTFITILCHHGRLKKYRNITNKTLIDETEQSTVSLIDNILSKEDAAKFFGFRQFDEKHKRSIGFNNDELTFTIQDYADFKLLFSKLIFADKYEAIFNAAYTKPELELPIAGLTDYKSRLPYSQERRQAADIILSNYSLNKGSRLFTLTAPTGIGKTLISLELALNIQSDRNYERVIYTIPFTSIIDQTAEIFERIYPEKVSVHHYKTDFTKNNTDEITNNYDRQKYITESWSGGFILSTLYQLCFALFSSDNSDNIKFQALRKSVIVIDEVQAIHPDLWKAFKELLPVLAERLDASFVLMSATMPIITRKEKSVELADKEMFYISKNRYRLEYLLLEQEDRIAELANKILDQYNSGRSVVCVVNTIKTCKQLYRAIKTKNADAFCLNSYMLPDHRKQNIKKLTEEGSNKVRNKILISTQVIEAGVDLDFDTGFRELAPLSSIIQTAGRVNREGCHQSADVFIFDNLTNFCIYSDIQMNATQNSLMEILKKVSLEEKDILPVCKKYFSNLDLQLGSGEARFNKGVKKFDFDEIDALLKDCFDEKGNITVSVAVGVDLKKLEETLKNRKIDDPWKFRSEKQRLLKTISGSIINIKAKDLKQCGVAPYLSEVFGISGFEFLSGIYSEETGFLPDYEKDVTSQFF